jgi:hypothetical protein
MKSKILDILRPTTTSTPKYLEAPRNLLAANMVGFQSSPATPRKRRRVLTMNPIAITKLLIPTLDDDHDMNKQEDDKTSTNSHHDTSGDHRRSVSCTRRMHLKPRPYQHSSGASGGALLTTTDFSIVEPEAEDKKQQYDRAWCHSSRSAPSHPHSSRPHVAKSNTGTTTHNCLQHSQKKTKFIGRLPQPRLDRPRNQTLIRVYKTSKLEVGSAPPLFFFVALIP